MSETLAQETAPEEVEAALLPPQEPDGDGSGRAAVGANLGGVALSGALACAAAAWLAGGLIQGPIVPRLIALLGVGLGVAIPYASLRVGRTGYMQYAVIPVAALAGAILVAPAATGGTANLPELIGEAIKGGGLLQPPIPFDPGWRFILVVFFAVLGAASIGIATALRRDRLAVLLPLPIALGCALLQPKGGEILASTVAIALILGAFAVSYGAKVAAEGGGVNARFETRRLTRGAAMLAALIVGMILLSNASFLFPNTQQDKVVPPRRPPVTPPEPDRVIFDVLSGDKGPWRVGVLDTYDGRGWLLPAYDPSKLETVAGGRIPGAHATADTYTARFHIIDMKGRSLPVPAEAYAIRGTQGTVQFDPISQVPGLDQRLPQGLSYTVAYNALPSAASLDAAAPPPGEIVRAYGSIASPPPRVQTLLQKAPAKPFERLQYLRTELYSDVVSAGPGQPIDVLPSRVNELLVKDTDATPWEITASEAMLARWAGIPSRIGFGYFGGDKIQGGYAVHPRNGAAWLEVYFQGYGWVPLVGTPPQARTSDKNTEKRQDNTVHASDRIAISVLIPTRVNNYLALWEIGRYWAEVLVPILLALLLAWYFAAWPIKAFRASRRRRWAEERGPRAQVLCEYAEMRDRCFDLNLGDNRDTPLEFAARFQADDEHLELAWLVTRILWGDLARDPQPVDAIAAREMSRSVRLRILERQGSFNLLLAAGSRASLRDPYSDELPNYWPKPRRARTRAPRRRIGLPRLRRLLPRAALAGATLLLAACAPGTTSLAIAYPANLPAANATIMGITLTRDAAAEKKYIQFKKDAIVSQGRVWLIKDGPTVEGTLQISLVDSDIDMSKDENRQAVENVLGGNFIATHIGTVRLMVRHGVDQNYYLWFPADRNAIVLFVLQRQFVHATAIVRAVILQQRGYRITDLPGNLFPDDRPTPVPGATPSPSASASPAPDITPTPEESPQP